MHAPVVPVQPQTWTAAPFYTKSSSRSVAALTMDWDPEYDLDHFLNWIISSRVHNPPISQILRLSNDNYSSYSANNQADERWSEHHCPPTCGGCDYAAGDWLLWCRVVILHTPVNGTRRHFLRRIRKDRSVLFRFLGKPNTTFKSLCSLRCSK